MATKTILLLKLCVDFTFLPCYCKNNCPENNKERFFLYLYLYLNMDIKLNLDFFSHIKYFGLPSILARKYQDRKAHFQMYCCCYFLSFEQKKRIKIVLTWF